MPVKGNKTSITAITTKGKGRGKGTGTSKSRTPAAGVDSRVVDVPCETEQEPVEQPVEDPVVPAAPAVPEARDSVDTDRSSVASHVQRAKKAKLSADLTPEEEEVMVE